MNTPRRPKPIKSQPKIRQSNNNELFIMGLDSMPVAKRLMQDNVKGGFSNNQYKGNKK